MIINIEKNYSLGILCLDFIKKMYLYFADLQHSNLRRAIYF